MKFMLVIALTAVLVGYSSTASVGSIWKCIRDKLEPTGNKWALQGYKGASQGEKGALQGYQGASQGKMKDCPQEGPPIDTTYYPSLSFRSNVTVYKSNCRERFNARDFIQVPRVEIIDADRNFYYTFLFVRQMSELHWAVSNIPGSYLLDGIGNIDLCTKLIGDYQPPVIEADWSITFRALIYRQTREVCDIRASDGSLPVIDKDFVQEHGLCGPLAATEVHIVA